MVEVHAESDDGEDGGAELSRLGVVHDVGVGEGCFFATALVVGEHAGEDGVDGVLDVGVGFLLDASDCLLDVVSDVFIAKVFVRDFCCVAIGKGDDLAAKGDFFREHSSLGF